jgi:hypothetical protein
MTTAQNGGGVTGRETIIAAICEIVPDILICDAERVADAIYSRGYVCVQRQPTADMIDAAWADALEEDACGVWRTMIGVSEGLLTREGIPK